MRFQKAKLVILLIGLFAFLGVAGRLAWFATRGSTTILAPAEDRAPIKAVAFWWDKHRRGRIWDQQRSTVQPRARVSIGSYGALTKADVSGAEPPKAPEPVEERREPTGPQPYTHFSEVFVAWLILGSEDFRQDDRVFLLFENRSPRAALGEAGRQKLGWYSVGQKLEPYPEITVEAIDPVENAVTFRMPKHRDPQGRYESYQGNEEDSQTKVVRIVPPTLNTALLGSATAEEVRRQEREQRIRKETSAARLRALDREPSLRTEETFPGSGVWTVGTEDLNELAEDYDERLRRDVSVSSYNKNGVVGIQVQRIAEGSVFAGRGIRQNDVVLSLNDQSVPTLSEAARYIRKHPEANAFEVKMLRNGREVTITYHVPR